MREGHRLMVLKNRVLKKILWPKRQEVAEKR
jgi:preprotein translocase subunit SecE